MKLEIEPVAKIYNDFTTKFGIPRQGGLTDKVMSKIVFEKKFRNPDALRGIEEYSHLWLVWHFSQSHTDGFVPTVRPPKLGGNTRMGVFATRSPFRPNPLGLSCVKLERVVDDPNLGKILIVSGADIVNGTEIFDIKPYLAYCDCKTDATNGFALAQSEGTLEVEFENNALSELSEEKMEALVQILSQDPRPAYQNDPERVYVMPYGTQEISFKVSDGRVRVVNIH